MELMPLVQTLLVLEAQAVAQVEHLPMVMLLVLAQQVTKVLILQ
jgi:hypothetical protein